MIVHETTFDPFTALLALVAAGDHVENFTAWLVAVAIANLIHSRILLQCYPKLNETSEKWQYLEEIDSRLR
jgi:hypothetical protein